MQTETQVREPPMDQIVVENFDPEGVVVNGIELSSENYLAALRQRSRFHNVSTSGFKTFNNNMLQTFGGLFEVSRT